jgi:hypothetical protein
MDERKTFRILPKAFRIKQEARKHFEIQTPLANIEPIEEGSLTPTSLEDLAKLVEAPLLEACQIFYDKGVETWMSSANKKDIAIGEVHIIIRYDSLSERNKQIAEESGQRFQYMNREYIKITMQVSNTTTVQQISRHMTEVASRFDSQK